MYFKPHTLLHSSITACFVVLFLAGNSAFCYKFEKIEATDSSPVTRPKEVVFGTSTTYSAFGHWFFIGSSFAYTVGFVDTNPTNPVLSETYHFMIHDFTAPNFTQYGCLLPN